MTGIVVHIVDGDTFDLVDETGQKIRVRMQAIDAPERGQELYQESKACLRRMVDGMTVQVVIDKIDRYGRTVGRVWLWEMDVEREMLLAGMAWHFKKYNREKTLADAEDNARGRGVGVWGE